jgi:CheY-like chemotaxis protein
MENTMKALRRKVLVIDDDPVVGKSFDRVLAESGYEVTTARDGREALERVDRERYDVVFTDIRMPGIDGIEVAESIRKARPWTPVVIITGYGTPENTARAEAAGVAGFLNKPLSPETIERSTRAALRVIEGGPGKAPPAPAAMPAAPAMPLAPAEPEAALAVHEKSRAVRLLKSAGMMVAAPLIGLACVVVLPFVGLGVLAWMAALPVARRLARMAPFLKNAGLFLAAPFIGLAYAVAFPFIGAGLLLWHAAKALGERSKTR